MIILDNWCGIKSNECFDYYNVNSRYVMYVSPKIFDYEFPTRHSLRFTQSGCVDQISVVQKYVYFVAKQYN